MGSKMLKKIFIILFAYSFCFILAGCGFKLRSQADIPPQLHTLYLKSDQPYGQFESQVRQTLTLLGVDFVADPSLAPATLAIKNTNLAYTTPNLSTTSQAQSYFYTYRVSFSLLNKKAQELLPTKTISATGILILQPNEILGSNTQVDVLQQQLQQRCLQMMLEILGSTQVRQIAKKLNNPP